MALHWQCDTQGVGGGVGGLTPRPPSLELLMQNNSPPINGSSVAQLCAKIVICKLYLPPQPPPLTVFVKFDPNQRMN